MQPWQVSLIVLVSVVVGAAVPLAVMMTLAVRRVSREWVEASAGVARTLAHVEVVAERIERLSRGLEGGDVQVAEVLTTVGHLAHGIEKNLRTMNTLSTLLTSLGTVAAALINARFAARAAPADAPGPSDGDVWHPTAPEPPDEETTGETN